MSPHTERQRVAGPVGAIEVAVDRPPGAPRGIIFIGHPHPLYGGTLDNKVVTTLARAALTCGWIAVRPNFRGVGATEGSHAQGEGETDDLLQLIDTRRNWLALDAAAPAGGAAQSPALPASLPIALAGFSFGSFVAARAAAALQARGQAPSHLVLVGAAAGKWPMPDVPVHTLLIHGEADETIPLSAVFAWARAQELPIVVLPGADHFFHRRLPQLKNLIIQYLCRTPIDVASQNP